MKVIVVSQKTFLASRWEWRTWRFKQQWYRVQRAGTDWQPLEVKPRALPGSAELGQAVANFNEQGSDDN